VKAGQPRLSTASRHSARSVGVQHRICHRLFELNVFDASIGDLEPGVAVGVEGAVHDGGDALFLRLLEVDALDVSVGDHVPPSQFHGVAEEGVRRALRYPTKCCDVRGVPYQFPSRG